MNNIILIDYINRYIEGLCLKYKIMFIVELESKCWIASWDGDPGRTIVKENAKKFKTKGQAKLALEVCRTYRHLKMLVCWHLKHKS